MNAPATGATNGAAAPAVPIASAIVCSYNARRRIDATLRSLQRQDIEEPFEIIVVDSGSDGSAEHVAESYPEVRLVRSERRFLPGAARNAGVDASRGRYICFVPDDAEAVPGYLRLRVRKHREGFPVVGGTITHGGRFHPVGLAGFLIEYSSFVAPERSLEHQAVPHVISYDRDIFRRFGPYVEDARTGEDTVFNARLVAAGIPIGFEPRAILALRHLHGVREFLHHQADHGRGMVRSVLIHGLPGPIPPVTAPRAVAAYRILLRYPTKRWGSTVKRLLRAAPPFAFLYVGLSPLIVPGLWAAAVAAWSEWRAAAGDAVRRPSLGRSASAP